MNSAYCLILSLSATSSATVPHHDNVLLELRYFINMSRPSTWLKDGNVYLFSMIWNRGFWRLLVRR